MKSNNCFVYFFQEIGIVVIGVLIVVFINNYKEKWGNEAYFEKILLAIENEINLNKMILDLVLNCYIEIYDFFECDSMDKKYFFGEIFYSFGGFQVVMVKNVSLWFFVVNKVELFDFEFIVYLLEIEQIIDILLVKIDRLVDFVYEYVNDSGVEIRICFIYLFMDIIDSESNFLKVYVDFMEENEVYLEWKGK